MKKDYEMPSVSLLSISKEDVLTVSLNEKSLLEVEIPGAMWEG